MGGLLSLCQKDGGAEEPTNKPLLSNQQQPQISSHHSQQPYQEARGYQAQPAAPAPAKVPKFTAKRDVDESGGFKKAEGRSGIFCRCGGPGSLVKLQPCGHNELCLQCAQTLRACPRCNVAITDSIPSFKVKTSL